MIYKHKTTETQAKLGSDNKYYIDNCPIGIPRQFIEDSKVWQKEDGYEILEHVDEKGNRWRKSGDWESCVAVGCGDGKKHIISIKRLNDNEIFSIGDEVSERLSDKKEFIIESFNVYHGRLVIRIKKKSTHTTTGFRFLDKVKESTIITEDGVELFGGESIYGVTDDFQLCYTSIATEENVQGCRVFAEKENAEKYIKENKPQYSLNDIKETVKKLGCLGTTLIEYLENNK